MKKFRQEVPKRTYKGVTKTNYRDYKSHLAKDFNNKCGYTDCSDFWFGGSNNFHIDHFIPWKKNTNKPGLKTDYNNLVYCCSLVNILKSDKEGDFLDPCINDYNKHFDRNDNGDILPKSKEGEFMYNEMKLYMSRYAIIWKLDQLKSRIDQLISIMKQTQDTGIRDLYIEVTKEYFEYVNYLRNE